MRTKNISYFLSEQEVQEVKTAINTIRKKLPFLVLLTLDEKKSMYKLGTKSLEFVNDCQDAAINFPQIFPVFFDLDEFKRDAELIKTLTEIQLLLRSLCEMVDDTISALGGEVMAESLEVYKYVSAAAATQPGLKTINDKLKGRFRNNGKRKPNASDSSGRKSQPDNL